MDLDGRGGGKDLEEWGRANCNQNIVHEQNQCSVKGKRSNFKQERRRRGRRRRKTKRKAKRRRRRGRRVRRRRKKRRKGRGEQTAAAVDAVLKL